MSSPRHLEAYAPEVQDLLRAYIKRVGTALGKNLEGIILYGSLVRGEYRLGHSNVNLLLTLAQLDGERLRTLAPVLAKWKHDRVATLLLTTGEIEHWAAQFPLEFGDLLDHRVLLAGRDPLATLRPDLEGAQEAILREVRANLLRVRQRYVEGAASNESALILLPMSVTALGPCLRGLLRLWELAPVQKTETAIQTTCDRLGIDPAPLQEAWSLRCGRITPGPVETPRLFDRYLVGLTALSDAVSVAAPGVRA